MAEQQPKDRSIHVEAVNGFFENVGVYSTLPDQYTSKDSYSKILRYLLKSHSIERGKVSCTFSVLPVVANIYGGLHGGAVAAIAERIAIACARTVVAEDRELFLGELNISYLSAAAQNEELIVYGSVVRSGRNVTVVSVEFKLKKTGRLVYLARTTFYNMPVAKL